MDQLNLMTYGPGGGYDLASYADAYHNAGFPYEKMIGGLESEWDTRRTTDRIRKPRSRPNVPM